MINIQIGHKNMPENIDVGIVITSKSDLKSFDFAEAAIKKIKACFTAKENAFFSLYDNNRSTLVSVFANEEKDNSIKSQAIRVFGAEMFTALEKDKVKDIELQGLSEVFSEEERHSFLEGMALAQYKFERYKKAKKETSLKNVYLADKTLDAKALTVLNNVVKAVSFAKDLVNQPLNYLNASKFSEAAKTIGKETGFTTEIFDKAKIQELKMGGLLGVNQGSENPPTFNIFTHKPKNAVNKKPLVLVGKGVMFDTGGYSVKTGGHMTDMKSDMAGAAAVVGTMMAISSNELPYYVIGLVPATDNMISAKAYVVDDVLTMYDGTTVEIQNTDAEGRLVLADALAYAKQFDPELVIDLATLTGAAAAITGPYGIAMAGNSKPNMDALKLSGDKVYERLMELPFWKEFEDLLKSEVADLKNIGGPVGGATTAGKFLEHFTDYDWIHLDIAGAATVTEAKGYTQVGATGVGIRLLYDFIDSRINLK